MRSQILVPFILLLLCAGGAPACAFQPPPLLPELALAGVGGAEDPGPPRADRGDEGEAVAMAGMRTGVLISLGLFATLLLTIGAALAYRGHKDRLHHETLRHFIEKGASIPPEMLTPRPRPGSDLRRGLLLLAAGLGLILSFRMTVFMPAGLWSLGLIPVLLGAGYLLSWRLERGAGARGADS